MLHAAGMHTLIHRPPHPTPACRSSFWNFDALFQPQQHPARDAHDTFFLTSAWALALPPERRCSTGRRRRRRRRSSSRAEARLSVPGDAAALVCAASASACVHAVLTGVAPTCCTRRPPSWPAEPAATPASTFPQDYLQRVKQTHQVGGRRRHSF